MDEFHYYADRERGVAWQVPLLTLPQARFLLMSATLGDTAFFEEELTRLNGRPTVTVFSQDRPVPLDYAYSEIALAQTLERLVSEGKSPVYVVHFTQLEAAQSAQDFTSLIEVTVRGESGEGQVAGTLFGRHDARIVSINSHRLEAAPQGTMLVVRGLVRRGVPLPRTSSPSAWLSALSGCTTTCLPCS